SPSQAEAVPSGSGRYQELVHVEAGPLDFIQMDFVVEDHAGRPACGLGASDFRLRVDGRDTPLEDIVESRSRTDRKISVALLLDVSGSMRGFDRERFLHVSQALLDRLGPSDEMTIVTFADTPVVQCDFTRDPERLRSALEAIPRPNWGTDLYAALAL